MFLQPICIKMKTDLKVYVLGLVLVGIIREKGGCTIETEFNVKDEKDCPNANSKWMKTEGDIAWGTPNRAFLTVPFGLRITDSKIAGAGHGVISDTFIPNDTWLAEYEGEIIPQRLHGDISDYAWQIHRDGERFYFVDANYLETSNWVRFINCARHNKEENVLMVECYGRPFYKISKPVKPGDELLVYYGRGYGEDLNIDVDNYYNHHVQLNFSLAN
eukprot:GHVU01119820.1.p1 GENE.GHVU01119820.1~~GHVU01119820.1.p1  ORF type:complete len:217 (+),score=21.81 GHVU01119820.1:113-763(+)